MRSVAVFILLFSFAPAYSQEYSVSSEYRRDIFDGEEESRSFFREKASVKLGDEGFASFAYVSIPELDRKSYTWNVAANSKNGMIKFIFGNFSAQFASGLLIGRVRPYVPDPFAREEEMKQGKVFAPVVTGYPAYNLYGAAVSLYSSPENPLIGFHFFFSNALRYYGNEDGTIGASVRTTLSHTEKSSGGNPVFVRAAGAMTEFNITRYLQMQFSLFGNDLKDPEDHNVLWSSPRDHDGIVSDTGASVLFSYNDGIVKTFCEAGLVRLSGFEHEEKYSVYGKGFQGKASVDTKRFAVSLSVKKLGKYFGTPYFSAIGKQTPSEAFFFDSRISPYEFFSLFIDSSVDKNTEVSSYSTERIPACKEGIRLLADISDSLRLSGGWRGTGESMNLSPQKTQSKAGILYMAERTGSAGIKYTRQESSVSVAHSAEIDVKLLFLKYFSVEGAYIRNIVKMNDEYYLTVLELDETRSPWLSVRSSSHLAGMKLRFKTDSVSIMLRGLARISKQNEDRFRFECSLSGKW